MAKRAPTIEEYSIKACGKRHSWCAECQPAVATAIGLTRERVGLNVRLPLEDFLAEGRRIRGQTIRARLVEAGIWQDRCAKCGIGPEWEGEPLALQVDHKDGNVFNSTQGNLRLLCPNCHSQTETYAGRNQGTLREMASPDVSP